MFQCSDIRSLWDPTIHSTCWGPNTLKGLSYTNSSLGILTDILFAIVIPLPMLCRLQVNPRTRASLICILGLGIFACIAGAVKVSYTRDYKTKNDFLWNSRNFTLWFAIELNVAITAASLPCLKPLFQTVLGSTSGRSSRGSSSAQHHGRKTWYTLPEPKRRSGREDILDDLESQTALELENGQSHAFVHNESGTTTEIGQADPERGEISSHEASPLPQDAEKSILTTTTTSVRYSGR